MHIGSAAVPVRLAVSHDLTIANDLFALPDHCYDRAAGQEVHKLREERPTVAAHPASRQHRIRSLKS